MLQQVIVSPRNIIFREVRLPDITANQVLVKIYRIGICGSDVHVYHGSHPFINYPLTQGHEVSGVISKVGENVHDLSEGMKVTIEPQVFCGKCHPCRNGKYNLCEELKVMGFQTTGAASEFFTVDSAKITQLPDGMGFDEGAMLEPLAVSVHAIKQAGDVAGMSIAVLGAGPIGTLVAQSAKGLGAKSVLITDVSDFRLQKAKECGIDFTVNTLRANFGDAVAAAFGPDKADVIFDCAGVNASIGQAIRHARKGSSIILVAVFEGIAQVDLAVLNDHELCLNTSMMYRHEDYLTAIDLVTKGKVRLSTLISAHFPFREYNSAYEYIDKNRDKALKILIDVCAD